MSNGWFGAQEMAYVDTPRGIFTDAGRWFRTREASLQTYAGPVLERVPLRRLLHHAEVWLRSPQTLTLWALPALLLVASPGVAAVSAIGLFVVWTLASPSLVHDALLGVMRLLDKVLLQALYYVLTLNVLAAQDRFTALGVGLAGFIVLRWGLVGKGVDLVVRPVLRALYRLPVPDQVLRAIIVRTALRHRLSLPELDRMEKQILRNMPFKN